MQIDGRIVAVNQKSRVAAADIGCGKSVVFEFQQGAQIDRGDMILSLSTGYQRICCENSTKNSEISVLILTGVLPLTLAKFIVGNKSRHLQSVNTERFVA